MAKQTFTTGQVLTAAQMTSLQETAMGGGPTTAKTANYVLVAADAGTTVAMDAVGATTITVNTGLFAAGDTVFIQNIGAGACTITAGTATVDTAGSLILPQYDAGILYFTATGAAIFYDYIQAGAVSPLTTKGDLYTFGTSDTRLAVGANGTTLVADSSTATGLKWDTPASGAMAQIATGTLSGSSINFTSLSTYNELLLFVSGALWNTGNDKLRLRINGNTGNNYSVFGINTEIKAVNDVLGDPVTSLSVSSFQLAVRKFAKRTDSDNIWIIKLTNCKTAGFTDIDTICKYNDADYSYDELETMKGIYAVSETVSSLELTTNSTLTFTAGSYTLWGA